MNSIVVIKVFDSASGLDFEIPLKSDGNSPFALSKSLSDLVEPTKRLGVQSHRFKVLISKEIASGFDFFNEAQHHNFKDIDSDKESVIIVDGNEIERGKIRITNYVKKDGVEMVELLFFGNNYDWKEAAKDLTLVDLTFNTTSFNYYPQTIKDTWANTVDNGDEYVFPLENRGGRFLDYMAYTEDFRPSFFLYSVIKQFLAKIGYTFSSTFFETTSFKGLVLSFYGDRFRVPQDYIDANIVLTGKARIAGAYIGQNDESINGTLNPLYFDKPLNAGFTTSFVWDDSTAPFEDAGANFDPAGGLNVSTPSGLVKPGRFTAPRTGYYNVNVKEEVVQVATPDFTNMYLAINNIFHYITYLRKYDTSGNLVNSIGGYTRPNTIIDCSGGIIAPTGQPVFKLNGTVQIFLIAGESFELWRFFHDLNVSNNITANFVNWFWKTASISMDIKMDKRISEQATVPFTEYFRRQN